jgi:hypothetical protein
MEINTSTRGCSIGLTSINVAIPFGSDDCEPRCGLEALPTPGRQIGAIS